MTNYKVASLRIVEERTTNYTNKVNQADVAIEIFQKEIGNYDREVFAVLCLDTKGMPTYFGVVHIGSLNMSIVHPREIFKLAVLTNANSVIVGHNHPSGELSPSPDDIEKTIQLNKAGEILGIELLDHLIVSAAGGKSMRKENNGWFINEKS